MNSVPGPVERVSCFVDSGVVGAVGGFLKFFVCEFYGGFLIAGCTVEVVDVWTSPFAYPWSSSCDVAVHQTSNTCWILGALYLAPPVSASIFGNIFLLPAPCV